MARELATRSSQLIDLVEFMQVVILPILSVEEMRGRHPPVIMKLDAEGAEYSVMPGLILSGALCKMKMIIIEWHPETFRVPGAYGRFTGCNMISCIPTTSRTSTGGTGVNLTDCFESLRRVSPHCNVTFHYGDDETCGKEAINIPL